MGTTQGSLSLDEFQTDVGGFVRQVSRDVEPVLISQPEGPSVVLQNADSYNQILDRLDYLEAVEAIREGLRDVEEGRVYPAREALAALAEELGISD